MNKIFLSLSMVVINSRNQAGRLCLSKTHPNKQSCNTTCLKN